LPDSGRARRFSAADRAAPGRTAVETVAIVIAAPPIGVSSGLASMRPIALLKIAC
jgi:hypothetical protein